LKIFFSPLSLIFLQHKLNGTRLSQQKNSKRRRLSRKLSSEDFKKILSILKKGVTKEKKIVGQVKSNLKERKGGHEGRKKNGGAGEKRFKREKRGALGVGQKKKTKATKKREHGEKTLQLHFGGSLHLHRGPLTETHNYFICTTIIIPDSSSRVREFRTRNNHKEQTRGASYRSLRQGIKFFFFLRDYVAKYLFCVSSFH